MGHIPNLPQEGDMLGRFKLLKQVGRGGMGMVFHALDTQLHVEVALKVLCVTDADQTAVSRFKHEVLLARRVSHPGICRVFDLHYEQGLFFITMEFCAGLTLEHMLQTVGVLSPWHTAQIISYVAKAMNAAHAQGVIHRDLKPGNIVVKPSYQISILDFGFSTGADITSVTKAGAAVGTVHYVAPEVLNHIKPTAAVDIYSVGVILYRCMTGYLPFSGDNIFAVMDAIRVGAVIPPRSVNPKLTKKMERVILKAMALNPADRYHSFRDLRKDLVDACGNKPKDLQTDPIAQMLAEVVQNDSPNVGDNVDPDSSSHFDLMPEPLLDMQTYGYDDITPKMPTSYKVAMVMAAIVVAASLGALGVLVWHKHSINQALSGKGMPVAATVQNTNGINRHGIVEAKMLAKGLLIGDNAQLDSLLKQIAQATGPDRDDLVIKAINIVQSTKIDKSFVDTKLRKLQIYINNLDPPERATGAKEIWTEASSLAARGQYEQANSILNTIVQ